MTEIDGWGPGVSRQLLDEPVRRAWLDAAHRALRAARPPGLVLGEDRAPGPGWNYYSVLIDVGDHRSRLLLNAAAKLVACANDDGSSAVGSLRFCEVPNPEVFAAEGFQVASVELMTSDLQPEHVAALGRTSRRTWSITVPNGLATSSSIGSIDRTPQACRWRLCVRVRVLEPLSP